MSRVLIVENQQSAAEALADYLEERGFITRVARSGEEALAAAPEFQPDVLLCSWLLEGGMNGAAVVRALRGGNPELPVVLISGLPIETFRAEIQGLSVDAVLVKPLSAEEVARTVRTVAPRS